jgi:UDP:flavonoid glycosyltransferase YjiC (YdhE family)
MEDMYTEARHLCAGNDLVIGHFFVFPLQVAAEKARVPIATVNIVHNCVPSRFICPPGIPDLGRWFYPFGWKVVRKLVNRIFLRRVNALRVREGLEPKRDVMDEVWAAERLNLMAVSPRLCERPPDWSPRHQICGFLNPPSDGSPEELPAGLEDFLASGPAPVYMTFGSMMAHSLQPLQETHSLWVKAAKRAKCRAILQIPWSDLSGFEKDPDVFTVERSPYLRVFSRCAAIVHHGGAGTTQASLLSGKPSIVVAHMADQTFWGSELRRLGVGARTLARNSLTSAKLAREITRVVSSPSMSCRAEVLGRQMAEEDGVRLAVTLIERTFFPVGTMGESDASRRASIRTQ